MAYVIFSKKHGVCALVEAPVHTAQRAEGYIHIPCESGADVNDTERWRAEAAAMSKKGYIAPTLERARKIKIHELIVVRDDIVGQGFSYGGHIYPISSDVQVSMLAQFQGAQIMPAPSYQWKDTAGIYREIGDAAAFQKFVVAAMMYGQSLFAREEMLQGLVSRAETIEEVQAITWETVPEKMPEEESEEKLEEN